MTTISSYTTQSGVRYRVRYRKPDGSQTDKRGFKRKRDAEQWAAEHVTTAKAQGKFIDPQDAKITVGEMAEAWLAKKRLSVKPSYIVDLEGAWRKWVEPSWAAVSVSDVTRKDVQTWVAGISGKGLSASVVLRAHGVLAGILDDAVKDRRIHDNPARGVELPRKTRRKHPYLAARQLFEVAENSGWRRDIVLTLGLCGMRWGELVPLRVRDIDLEKHRIYIGVSAPMVNGKPTPGDTKTHESRSIMYPSILDDAMHSRCDGRSPDDLVFEAPNRPGEMIREYGGASSREDGWLRVALKRAGVAERLTIHDLRHTAASLMVRSGANVKAVQRQLGHASAAMTLDVYADLFDDDLDALSEAMSDLLLRENVGKMWADGHVEAA